MPLLVVSLAAAPALAAPGLGDALRARGGKTPVYLAAGTGGLVASAADGTWSEVLVAGAVDAAALDAAQELVWLARQGRLEVLDLRAPAPVPVPIVRSWYLVDRGPFAHPPGIWVAGTSNADNDAEQSGMYPTLRWKGKTAKLGAAEGVYVDFWPLDQVQLAARKARLLGRAWLQAQASRRPRSLPPRRKAVEAPRVKLPEGLGSCEMDDWCGTAWAFGPTGFLLVTTEQSCGDTCLLACKLVRPGSDRFVSPLSPGVASEESKVAPCKGYRFDASGRWFLVESEVCTLEACVTLPAGAPFAWLDPGDRI